MYLNHFKRLHKIVIKNFKAKKKELHLQLEEENRRVRMRSVGNVRFIGK